MPDEIPTFDAPEKYEQYAINVEGYSPEKAQEARRQAVKLRASQHFIDIAISPRETIFFAKSQCPPRLNVAGCGQLNLPGIRSHVSRKGHRVSTFGVLTAADQPQTNGHGATELAGWRSISATA